MSEGQKRSTGYHGGSVDTVILAEALNAPTQAIAGKIEVSDIMALANDDPFLVIEDLHAGYGRMEILHGLNLAVARKHSLCLIGSNGAGKSTILHAIFGFNNIFSGSIAVGDGAAKRDISKMSPQSMLKEACIADILQGKSVFPGMTV